MKRALPVALLALAAAAGTAASAAARGSQIAYFRVSAQAQQDISWSRNVVVGGSCGTTRAKGQGGSWLRLHTPAPQVAVARQIGNESRVQFTFKPYLHVEARLQREGKLVFTSLSAGHGSCGEPLPPVASDCGVREFPSDTQIGLEYDPPDKWPNFDGPPPLVPSLHISGPYSRRWLGKPLYTNCPGEQDDNMLGIDYVSAVGRDTGAKAISMQELFGKRQQFTVSSVLHRTEQHPLFAGETGTYPVTTTLTWSVTFTRITRKAAARSR